MQEKLYEIVERLEQELAANNNQKLNIHRELALLYQYSNSDKAIYHAEQVLNSDLPDYHPLKLRAAASKISGMLSNTNYSGALEFVSGFNEAEIELEYDRVFFLLHKAIVMHVNSNRAELERLIEYCEPYVLQSNDADLYLSYVIPKSQLLVMEDKDTGSILFKALEYSRPKPWATGYIYTLLAEWADENNQREIALQHLENAINICTDNKAYLYMIQAYLYRFNLYSSANEQGTCEEDINEVIRLTKLINNQALMLYALQKRVNLLIIKAQFNEALEDLDYLEDLFSRGNEPLRYTTCLRLRGVTLFKMGEYEKALAAFENYSLVVSKYNKFAVNTFLDWDISNCHSKLGNYKLAYEYLLKYYNSQKEVNEKERKQAVAEMQTRYETELKEKQLRQLEINNLNSELKLLKSQMNPHFLFNTISTVNSLLQTGNIPEAQQALQNIATLTRSTLEQSKDDETLLEDEIAFINSYLQLEGRLLGSDFSFTIETSNNIDPEFHRVPAMLIQPLVENALKHGLRHKQGDKLLKLQFTLTEGEEQSQLIITITDNGIGRAASDEINKQRKKHTSFAAKSIEERIKIINLTAGYEKLNMLVEDLYENNTAAGTRVVITVTT